MKTRQFFASGLALALALFLLALLASLTYAQDPTPQEETAPVGTAFTYQGRLGRGVDPINTTCQMVFRLYDAAADGAMVGTPITTGVLISDSLFTVSLDFGAAAFQGDARWLGIQVQCPVDAAYTDLGRQALTAAPYALYAQAAPWSGLTGVPAGFADHTDNDTTYSPGFGLALAGQTFGVVTDTVQARVSSSCTVGSSIRAVAADGIVTCETDDDTILTAGNQLDLSGSILNVMEGSGSGLDADLLDGYNSDYYRTYMETSQTGRTTIITSTCSNYAGGSITIDAARAGTIVVEASVHMLLGHVNGTEDLLVLGIAGTPASCGESPSDDVYWTIPSAYPSSGNGHYSFTVRRAFTVAADTYTYYLNGQMYSGGSNDDAFWFAAMHATFYPE